MKSIGKTLFSYAFTGDTSGAEDDNLFEKRSPHPQLA